MIFSGAAPLGAEISEKLRAYYPNWKIRQGYGEFVIIDDSSLLETWSGKRIADYMGIKIAKVTGVQASRRAAQPCVPHRLMILGWALLVRFWVELRLASCHRMGRRSQLMTNLENWYCVPPA
jgi:hypothetical protein